MSVTLNGTTGYLTLASPIVTAGMPFWMCAWITDGGSTGATQTFVSQSKLDSDRYSGIFRLDNSTPVAIHAWSSSSDAVSGATPFDATPRVAIASFGGTTAGQIKLWAGSAAEGVGSIGVTDQTSTHTGLTIGGLRVNGNAAALLAKCNIAEVHFFTGTPTDTEYTTLAGGALPETISGWIDGFKLLNATDLTSIGGSRTLTLVGGVTSTGSHPITRATAPILTSPTGAATGNTTANAGATIDAVSGSGSRIMYALARIGGSPASSATIISTGTQLAVTSAGAKSVPLTGLTPGASYSADVVYVDATTGTSNVVTSTWTQPTPPTLSAPTKSDTSTTATGGFTTDGTDGTARMVWIESSTQPTAPSAAQVKAGQNAAGTTVGVVAPAALTITSAGAKNFAAAPVNTQKTHWGYAVHTNAATNDSNVLALGPVYPGTWRSAADVTVTGWSVTGAATHAAAINEDAPGSAAEFIVSPGLTTTPATHLTSLDKSLPAGSYNEQITASVSSGTALLNVAYLDNGGTVQGTSADQTITTTPTTFTLPVTTTGAATRKRISVRTP